MIIQRSLGLLDKELDEYQMKQQELLTDSSPNPQPDLASNETAYSITADIANSNITNNDQLCDSEFDIVAYNLEEQPDGTFVIVPQKTVNE